MHESDNQSGRIGKGIRAGLMLITKNCRACSQQRIAASTAVGQPAERWAVTTQAQNQASSREAADQCLCVRVYRGLAALLPVSAVAQGSGFEERALLRLATEALAIAAGLDACGVGIGLVAVIFVAPRLSSGCLHA